MGAHSSREDQDDSLYVLAVREQGEENQLGHIEVASAHYCKI